MGWRGLWAPAVVLSAMTGCNALLSNKLYGLDPGDASVYPPDAIAPDSGPSEAGGPLAVDSGGAEVADAEGGKDAGPDIGTDADRADAADGGCMSLTEVHSCGSCTMDCAQFPHVSATGLGCAGGRCTYSCLPGYADCADSGAGCTTALSSPSSCGGCGVVCSGATPVCLQSDGGTEGCASDCPAGQTNCNGACSDLQTDRSNCGACGASCARLAHVSTAGLACSAGKCSYLCAAGFADCGNTGTGCNTSLGTATNCSGCGAGCSGATPSCGPAGGTYACNTGCAAGQANCSGTCATLATDTNNCGSCGHACAVGGQQCVGASCQCPASQLNCSGICQSANACGGCGTLVATPGANCGTCGTYVCSADKTSVTCNDPGTTNSCPTWCTAQSVPSGVAASDYQCVDFDNGMPSTSTWTQTVSGSAALARSTAAADSAPDSLAVSVTGGSDNATLTWNDVGSTPVKSISVLFAINPMSNFIHASGGNIDLACINTGSNSTCIYYTNNGTDANGNTGFTGISAFSDYNGGSVSFGPCQLSTTNLNSNVWNTVEVDMTIGNASGGSTTGQGQILINGTVANSSCIGQFMNSTVANVVIGPAAVSATFGWSGYFDNITVAVKR
jgi:hypothetical protein